jgi:hypothetical protein
LNVLPRPASVVKPTLPPWASTMLFQIASARPLPPAAAALAPFCGAAPSVAVSLAKPVAVPLAPTDQRPPDG